MWKAGKRVLWQDLQRERLLWEAEHRVVVDSPELAALYIAPGTVGRRPADALRTGDYAQRLLSGDWHLSPFTWHSNHTLRLIEPGAAHAVELYWSGDWDFRGWYVNLQSPLRRTAAGFAAQDHALDVVIHPDGSWEWKDEDDLAALVRVGYYSELEASAFYREGGAIVEKLSRRESPFGDDWELWRPPSCWEQSPPVGRAQDE